MPHPSNCCNNYNHLTHPRREVTFLPWALYMRCNKLWQKSLLAYGISECGIQAVLEG